MEKLKEIDKKAICPLTFSLGIIGGKWKPIIIYNLNKSSKRFGQLDAQIPHISRKVLTSQLNELIEDGIVVRHAYAETPPRVEYQLTKDGKALIPIMNSLCRWGMNIIEKEENIGNCRFINSLLPI